MNYKHAKKVMAKACGINTYIDYCKGLSYYPNPKNKQYGEVWTINDPRCREVILDYLVEAELYLDKLDEFYGGHIKGHFKTKKACEIACILAIVKEIDNGK